MPTTYRFYNTGRIAEFIELERAGKLGPRRGKVLQAWRTVKADHPTMKEMSWDGVTGAPVLYRRELGK